MTAQPPASEGSGAAPMSRRALIAGTAASAGAALLASLPAALSGQAATDEASPVVPPDPTKVPGPPTSATSARSPFVQPARTPTGQITGASFTPLQDLTGTITPTDLHFERHHGGVAMIDPARYRLLIHGLVDRPTVFTLDDLKRLPSVTRIHFLECSGNGRSAYRSPSREMTPQLVDGLTSNAEWTGVRLTTLLAEVGARAEASWILAEGGDAAVLSRSIPMAKAQDDALVVYAQNGEPLRPAAGYPARLLLPGWEGNANIKWLRRLELIVRPNMSRDETSRYTDPLPDGTARQFSFVMDPKSLITRPAHPARLERGWIEISGIAWSGRGKITRVDLSTDEGRTWTAAELQDPVLSKAHTRFTRMWRWNGESAVLMSRAADETGAVQPTLAEFQRKRGRGTDYHFNYIRAWLVERDGQVVFGADL
jgi:sulfane dehydrogenase subunit SoxC